LVANLTANVKVSTKIVYIEHNNQWCIKRKDEEALYALFNTQTYDDWRRLITVLLFDSSVKILQRQFSVKQAAIKVFLCVFLECVCFLWLLCWCFIPNG
jgi:hypothetical protein